MTINELMKFVRDFHDLKRWLPVESSCPGEIPTLIKAGAFKANSRKHLGEFFENWGRETPRCIEMERKFAFRFMVDAEPIAVPLRTPVLYRPVVPIVKSRLTARL